MSFVSKAIGNLTGTTKAAKEYSKAQQRIAEQSKFAPYAVTTGFGESAFGDKTATYTLDPTLAQFRDIYYQAASKALPSATELQAAQDVSAYGRGLFSEAAQRDLGGLTSDYYQQQLSLLQPERTMEDIRLRENLYGTGRGGLGVSLGTGGYVNPEQYGASLAREQANLGLLMSAEDRARQQQMQDIQRGLSYQELGRGMEVSPYTQASSLFGLGAGLEQMGMGTIGMGQALGSAAVPGQQLAANALGSAAQNQYSTTMGNIGLLSSLATSAFQGAGGWGGLKSYGQGMFSSPASAPSTPQYGSTAFWRGY